MPMTLKDTEQNVICGLGSYTYTVLASEAPGLFYMSADCNEVPTSSITITLAQSGSKSVSVTSPAPTATQQNIKISQLFFVAAGDVLTCTIATSDSNVNDPDNQLNTVKTLVILRQGQ